MGLTLADVIRLLDAMEANHYILDIWPNSAMLETSKHIIS
jgi:hypothetical protein